MNDIPFSDIAEHLNQRIEDLARELLGEPNNDLSTQIQLRYGTKGSIAIEINGSQRGRWYDHEQGIGGDGMEFVRARLGLANGAACDWARDWLGLPARSISTTPENTSPHQSKADTAPSPEISNKKPTMAEKVNKIVADGQDIEGTPAETYLRNRGIIVSPLPTTIRFRPNAYGRYGAAVGALSGELHGGANYEVMRMLLDIKTEDSVEPYIKEKFTKNERIMGMGHAVYKTVDPRSQVLKELSKKLSEKTSQPWYDITSKVEHVTAELMKKTKGVEIFPNVDLYSASVYYMLGIPMDLNTPIFAISRAAGWAAHIIEEKFAEAAPKPMLYRPKAVYIGKYAGSQGCKYIPIEKRIKK